MNEPQTDNYEFGDFRLCAVKRLLLRRDGEQIPLTPKVFDTLFYLVRHAGKIIEKDELIREIWTDTVVEENNLSQNVSILRRILGEKRGEHRFIATIPGKGFKFVASVRVSSSKFQVSSSVKSEIGHPEFQNESKSEIERLELQNELENNNEPEAGNLKPEPDQDVKPKTVNQFAKDKERKTKNEKPSRIWGVTVFSAFVVGLSLLGFYAWRENRKADAAVKTVAVLPFKPLVADNRDEALEMGMADTLIARLGGNREIIVRPLSSVRKYGNLEQDALIAGRALDVESVLDGSLQRWGDKIRVNVRLIKVADGTLLWTGTFDEKFTDIFVVQDVISQRVATALAFQLSGDEQKRLNKRYTENVEAYQSYSKGRFHWNKRTPQDLQKSIEYFEQAIALDPNYALAFTGLADAYALQANAGSPARELMPKAKQAVSKALSLDDNLAEAHAALGQIVVYYDYDFVGAEREYKRAIELDPNYATAHQWYSELLMGLGTHEEALAEIRWALEIDPLSLLLNRQYGASLLFARQYDASIAQMKKTVDLDANFA
ncbi:MAG: winged helix-turn-helix domain-containing protein, partial [Acidobacteriota bacterium]|nr:winged helix-turn-helix domain-containing protein [Acidobacteriota bacterium]